MTRLISRTAVTWRYLTSTAKCRHALQIEHQLYAGHDCRAVCGLETFRPQDWYGTGSQAEYDRCASLPECRRCTARLGATHHPRRRAMTTDPTTQAVRTVARRVLTHIIAATEVSQRWEDYPDIGEDDWQAVAAEVRRLAERTDVQTEHYDSAYRHLAGRAERSPA